MEETFKPVITVRFERAIQTPCWEDQYFEMSSDWITFSFNFYLLMEVSIYFVIVVV